jgi:hypothetical protein
MEDCVRHAAILFQGLRQLDPSFAQWFEKAWSRKKALQLGFEPTEARLRTLLSRKKYQLTSASYRFAAWNGLADNDSTAVGFFCGGTSALLVGTCVVDLPSKGAVAERLLTADRMTELLRLMAVAWDPDWGVVTSDDLGALLSNENDDSFTGWITYLARRRGELPPLPEPCQVEPVGEQGWLILLTPERCTASNPAHVELATEVQAQLRAAGLIRPRPRPSPPA